ncbi:response regulator transcription factor [Rhodococcus erythropolis]|nr:response regulator transcription factor [Rhodococcus erythropolis]MDV6272972.1 response regulator transcription factor [Rhodococcus erythropolis]
MEDPVTTTIRVFLVDDHLVVRAGLRALLDTQPDVEVVGEASSGEEAATAMPSASPDLVMMDLDMGSGMHGAEAIKRLRNDGVDVPVLVFTTYDTDADVVRAVDAGAIGYLLKDSTPDEIFGAVRGAVAGRSVLSPTVASRLVQQMQRPQEALTARESELLSLLAEGMTNRELGKALFISEATVKTHLGHIYAKLGVDTRSAAVSVALRRDGIR